MKKVFENSLIQSYENLKNEKDLSPRNSIVNESLSNLVCAANKAYEPKICIDCPNASSVVKDFRKICARSECEMEKYWADHYNNYETLTYQDLESFWYFDNYEVIADKEVNLIKKFVENLESKKLVFVGAGSLPLTALIMHVKHGLNVTLVDYDQQAVENAKKIVNALGLDIQVECCDFFSCDLTRFDFVFLASLVENKQLAFDTILKANIKYFMLRGADGVYQAFYEDLPAELKTGIAYSYLPSDSMTLNSSYLFYRS